MTITIVVVNPINHFIGIYVAGFATSYVNGWKIASIGFINTITVDIAESTVTLRCSRQFETVDFKEKTIT